MPYCGNIAALQLFLLSGATSISIASIPWTSIFPGTKETLPPPARRNVHLKYGALTSALCGAISIAVNLASQYTEDPVGLGVPRSLNYVAFNGITLFWSICLVTLASMQRYSTYLKENSRVSFLNIVPKLVMTWFLVLTVIAIANGVATNDSTSAILQSAACKNGSKYLASDSLTLSCSNSILVYPTQASLVGTLFTLTGIVPIIHVLFGMIWLYNEVNGIGKENSLSPRNTLFNLENIFQNGAALFVSISWLVYLILAFSSSNNAVLRGSYYPSDNINTSPAMSESGLLGSIYLLCNSFVLACESAITSEALKLRDSNIDENDDENQKDIFFTTTNMQNDSKNQSSASEPTSPVSPI